MQTIDMQTWSRREHFEFFNAYGYPHFGMCANVDLTTFYPAVKQRGCSLTIAIVYLITRVSNEVPEFRYRIRGEQVVEHETINPRFTFLGKDDTFSFCFVKYVENFYVFEEKAAEKISLVKENPSLQEDFQDDVIYLTAIPWVSFTSFLHPMRLQPEDSVPRFAWGKIIDEGDLLQMPLGVQGHHAVMDGVHVGRFYTEIEKYLQHPEALFN